MKPRFCLPLTLLAFGTLHAAEPPEPRFLHVTLDSTVQIGYGLAIADVDGDKLPDILLADKKQFVWYRNPGPEKVTDPAAWQKHLLAENLTPKDNVCIAAQDIDGDGKCEIAVGAEWNPGDTVNSGAVFYLIAPADRTQPWQPVKLPAEPTVHRMKWAKVFHSGSPGAKGERTPPGPRDWGLLVVPLHGRGNKNGQGAGSRVLRYRPPESLQDAAAEWKTEVVSDTLHMTHNFQLLSRENSEGFLLGSKEGLSHVYPEFSEAGAAGWKSKLIAGAGATTPSDGVGEVRVATASEESVYLATVEPMHGHQLVIYTNPFAPQQTRHVLTDQITEGHALAAGELLPTQGDQIVLGWRGNPQKPEAIGISLFTPLDSAGEKWRTSVIDSAMACEDLLLADLNVDGKQDIIAAGRSSHNLKIYLNQTVQAAP